MHREACGLLSTGLQRVAHDRASNTHAPSLLSIAEECSTECVTHFLFFSLLKNTQFVSRVAMFLGTFLYRSFL